MRGMPAAIVTLALAAATAQGVVVTTVTWTGTWVVGTTSGDVTVDTYKVTQTAVKSDNPSDPNWVLQSVVLAIGNMVDDPNDPGPFLGWPDHGDDPFQAWRYYGDGDYAKTVTNEAATVKLTNPTIRAADTHFLVPGLGGTGSPIGAAPDEVNDACYQNPQDPGIVIGTGVLFAAVGIPTAPVDLRAHTLDVATVGVVRGMTVWGWTDSGDWDWQGGEYLSSRHEFLIPEPGTLALLALGGLAPLRRRRSGFSPIGAGRDSLARAFLPQASRPSFYKEPSRFVHIDTGCGV